MIRWVNRQVRIWWPAAAAVVGGAILATLGFVVTTVVEARAQDRLRNDQLGELVEQQAAIIDRDQRIDAQGDQRLQRAIGEVEQLLADQFAEHDTNVATKLNDLLAQIAALLGRPSGVVSDPVSARDVDGTHHTSPAPRSPRSREPASPGDAPPPSTTTTTSPGRSDLCDRIPSAFPCRSPR